MSSKKVLNKEELKKQIDDIIVGIKNIEIQGATNVAKATVSLLGLYVQTFDKKSSVDEILSALPKFIEEISHLRETEPLARNGLKYIMSFVIDKDFDNVEKLISVIVNKAEIFIDLLESHKKQISNYGKKLIKNNDNVFTHCHSSTVEGILIQAHKEAKKDFTVFNDETRPLLQGHITSKNLRAAGIDNTIVVDGVSPYLISHHSGKDLMMDKVFLGTDAIALDGGCVNKIGSYGISLSAHNEKIKVYIATTLLKLDTQYNKCAAIKIEQRDANEVWEDPPKGLKVINLAFDLVPPEFIAGYITEFGLIKTKNLHKVAKEKYPWLFNK